MVKTKLRKVGGSVMVAIPPAFLAAFDLSPQSSVGLEIADGHIIVKPGVRPRYTLSELLAACDPTAPATVSDDSWDEAPAVGDETI